MSVSVVHLQQESNKKAKVAKRWTTPIIFGKHMCFPIKAHLTSDCDKCFGYAVHLNRLYITRLLNMRRRDVWGVYIDTYYHLTGVTIHR